MGNEPLTCIVPMYQKGSTVDACKQPLVVQFFLTVWDMQYCKPSFINLMLLEDQSISIEKLLEDETAAMTFPLDAEYFDDFL